jgi:hypothetical protein
VFIRPAFLLFFSLCLFIFSRLFFSVLLCRTEAQPVGAATLDCNEAAYAGRNRRGEKREKEREDEEEEEKEDEEKEKKEDEEDEEGDLITLWNRATRLEFAHAGDGVDAAAANLEAKWDEPEIGALKRENIADFAAAR